MLTHPFLLDCYAVHTLWVWVWTVEQIDRLESLLDR